VPDEYLQSLPSSWSGERTLRRRPPRPRARTSPTSARDETAAIYGEALELIAYIVKNDRPFTEMGTADYTVANELFQRDMRRMPYQMEPVVGSRVAADALPRRPPARRPAVDERVLRGLGHEQHEREPAAREPLVDRVPLLQLPRHAGRRHA
jgi:hypothetical protein